MGVEIEAVAHKVKLPSILAYVVAPVAVSSSARNSQVVAGISRRWQGVLAGAQEGRCFEWGRRRHSKSPGYYGGDSGFQFTEVHSSMQF
jgi:hypothetical protein